MESSRRDLLNYLAKDRSVLKNYQSMYHPRKTGMGLSKTGVLFLLCRLSALCKAPPAKESETQNVENATPKI